LVGLEPVVVNTRVREVELDHFGRPPHIS
jgi:hypothetical protein